VIVPGREFTDPVKVAEGLADNGGAAAIRVTRYTPEPAMAGKTLEEIAAAWHETPVEAYMRIVKATSDETASKVPMESVLGESMSEDDVRWFVSQPNIMFCTDGELHGAHPRGAGAFPRILGRYVRADRALTLELAVRKMTGLAAAQLGLKDRGKIAVGYAADLVLFDPATVIDQSTIEHPQASPLGIPGVMVGGEWVVDQGRVTGRHPGRVLRSAAYRAP
jgi:N-acyl-D-amino-acid deacylase